MNIECLLDEQAQRAVAERAELRNLLIKIADSLENVNTYLTRQRVGYRSVRARKSFDQVGMGAKTRVAFRPTLETALNQPAHVCEMGHESLAELALQGNSSAHRERLLREIMCTDNVSWEEAHKVLEEMDIYNERFYWLETLAYRVGITIAFCSAIGGTLMVFWKPVAFWYGTEIVGEELPEGAEEMTINQVGTWTWTWMEPMIGTASFVLLCAQFGRQQLLKIKVKPFTEVMLSLRANRLAKRFPKYDTSMMKAWAKDMPSCNFALFPNYHRSLGFKGPTSGL